MPDCASRIWDVDAAADYAVGLLLWLDRSVSERELHKNEKKMAARRQHFAALPRTESDEGRTSRS